MIQTLASVCWSLSLSPCLSAVGFELSSVGRLQQQQLCGDPVRACDVFSLQSADGSSAAHANTAQPGQLQRQHTHHLPHRHTHQSRASHQGKMHLMWHVHTAAFNSLFLVPPHSANALQWFYHKLTRQHHCLQHMMNVDTILYYCHMTRTSRTYFHNFYRKEEQC